jgi:hypothetical protein
MEIPYPVEGLVGIALGNKLLSGQYSMQLMFPLFVGEIEGGICRLSVFSSWDEFVIFLEEFRNDLNDFQYWDADLSPLVYNPAQSELSDKMFRAFIKGIDHYTVPSVKAYSVASNNDLLLLRP